TRVVPTYGAVSAAKAALESHCRQLAMELARRGTGISVNAIRAGVTVTPALMKIPEHDAIIEASTRRNPSGRMTTPQDVGRAIVPRGGAGHDFARGNAVGVGGGKYTPGCHFAGKRTAWGGRRRGFLSPPQARPPPAAPTRPVPPLSPPATPRPFRAGVFRP